MTAKWKVAWLMSCCAPCLVCSEPTCYFMFHLLAWHSWKLLTLKDKLYRFNVLYIYLSEKSGKLIPEHYLLGVLVLPVTKWSVRGNRIVILKDSPGSFRSTFFLKCTWCTPCLYLLTLCPECGDIWERLVWIV